MDTIKKRLMFNSNDDPYYMCFWILITLDQLGKKDDNYFKDSRKLLFIILLLSDNNTFDSIIRSMKFGSSKQEQDILFDSYKDGITQISRFNSLLITLEKKRVNIYKKK